MNGTTSKGMRVVWGMVTVLVFLAPWARAAVYSGGTGVELDPYQIGTVEDWTTLSATPADWDKHFLLTADLDFGGAVLTPVGNLVDHFTGVVDGDGHVLRNGQINLPENEGVGVFGLLQVGSAVHDLGVEGISVTGKRSVGGLAGWNSGTVTSCYAASSVKGDWNVGGLVGSNYGTVTLCYSTGAVAGNVNCGGLVAFNSATITASYATGTVTSAEDTGGNTGGLVGVYRGTLIADCYATGAVSGGSFVGGLVGYKDEGTLTSCYATGAVTGTTYWEWKGGLVGYIEPRVEPIPITACYWDTDTSGLTTSAGGEGRTTDEMTSPYAANTYVGWDLTTIWAEDLTPFLNNGYPYLRSNLPVPVEVEGEGEGEGEAPPEGEVLVEGEGEVLPEGEGEVLPEGEGEALPEGEGEVLPEGEGEVLPEGEGEVLAEGEGEHGGVNIPDQGLDSALRDALGLGPEDPITESALAGITDLNAFEHDIVNLTGLEYCTSLTVLWLNGNAISDLAPLQGLTGLTHLALSGSQISDLAPLQGLASLKYLGLSINQISDITPLHRLTDLTELYLDDNQISDLTPLQGLTSLKTLSVLRNQISDLTPLQGLTSLRDLYLEDNCISNLLPLLGLPDLWNLYVDHNPLSDTTISTQIPQLEDNRVSVDFRTYSDENCTGLEGEPDDAEGEVLPEGEVQPEGEVLPEGEGEVLLEGEGEVQPEGEGEVPAEGETEGEGESAPCGCGSAAGKDLTPDEWLRKTLGDWLLVGLSITTLFALGTGSSRS